jgi:hypothetical protein
LQLPPQAEAGQQNHEGMTSPLRIQNRVKNDKSLAKQLADFLSVIWFPDSMPVIMLVSEIGSLTCVKKRKKRARPVF